MAMDEKDQNQSGKSDKSKKASRNVLRIVISLFLIAAGIGGARFLIATKPTVSKRPPAKMEPLVRAVNLQKGKYSVKIPVMGTVMPAKEIGLKVPAAGEVVFLHQEFTEDMLSSWSRAIRMLHARSGTCFTETRKWMKMKAIWPSGNPTWKKLRLKLQQPGPNWSRQKLICSEPLFTHRSMPWWLTDMSTWGHRLQPRKSWLTWLVQTLTGSRYPCLLKSLGGSRFRMGRVSTVLGQK
jgi:hypothetical protein